METKIYTDGKVIQLAEAAKDLQLPVDAAAKTAIGITYSEWLEQKTPMERDAWKASKDQTNILGAAIQALIHEATAPLQ